ncbi:hypothetical protein LJC26_00455 [Desulfovibrio sp. OttesenSCG-928-O18]|nr:hypothetical protein [Desulfovibrio sp. OttesenSCG-928-O18]
MEQDTNTPEHGDAPAKEHCAFCEIEIREADLPLAIVRNDDVICPQCAPQALRDNIAQAKKIKSRALTAIIIAAALMFVGLFSAYTGVGRPAGDSTEATLLTIIFFFGVAALPSVWYSVLERGLSRPLLLPGTPGMVLRLVAHMCLAFVLGIFLAPMSVLQNLKALKNLDAQIAGCETLLKNY